MESILEQKPQKSLKGWLIATVLTACVMIAGIIIFTVNYNQAAAGMYGFSDLLLAVLGAVSDSFGVVTILGLVFALVVLIGKKNSRNFIKFMLWAIMLLSLYYAAPKFIYFYQVIGYASQLTTVDMLYYLSCIIPHIVFIALGVSYIVQFDCANKKITSNLARISFIVAIAMFVVQILFVVEQVGLLTPDTPAANQMLQITYYAMGALGVLFMVFFSLTLYKASAAGKLNKEAVLDEAIEKIAEDVSEEKPEEGEYM